MCRGQQDTAVAPGTLIRRLAEHQPRQLFRIRHIRRRHQTNRRPLRRSRDFHTGLDRQIAPHSENVQPRIANRPLKIDDAALDVELLPIGVKLSANGTNTARRTRQSGIVGTHTKLPGQAALHANATKVKTLAKIRIQIETHGTRRRLRRLRRLPGFARSPRTTHHHVVRQTRPRAIAQDPEPGIGTQFSGHIQQTLADVRLAVAGNHHPVIGLLHHTDPVKQQFHLRFAAIRSAQGQFSARLKAPRRCDQRLCIDVLVKLQSFGH